MKKFIKDFKSAMKENEDIVTLMERLVRSKCNENIIDKLLVKIWRAIFKTSLAFTTTKELIKNRKECLNNE